MKAPRSFFRRLPSEHDTNLTNESETINVNSNLINGEEAESSQTVQASDEAKDSFQVSKADHPSSEGGSQAPQGRPLSQEVQRLPELQSGAWGDGSASETRGSAEKVSEAESETEAMSR